MKPFLLFCLAACSFFTSAQEVFTLKGAMGINGCQIHGDNYSGYDKFGILAGPAVNARLGKRVSMEMGFYFSQKGSKHIPDIEKGDYSYYRAHLNYLDIPLMGRYQVNERYFVTVGPSVAYLISYKEETERGDWTGMYPFNKVEIGINFGLGANLGSKWSVELRSSNSLTPVRDWGVLANQVYYSNAIARAFNKGLYNNILSFFLSYHFQSKNGTS